jgi:hypothetical protein
MRSFSGSCRSARSAAAAGIHSGGSVVMEIAQHQALRAPHNASSGAAAQLIERRLTKAMLQCDPTTDLRHMSAS